MSYAYPAPCPDKPRTALKFDAHLDDSKPWRVEEIDCACGRRYIAVYRIDKYPVCPKCVITDRAVPI